MSRFNGVLKLHVVGRTSKFNWLALPWLILLSSFTINLIISILLGGNKALYTGGLSSIYIYMLIGVIVAVNSTFPFALGFSIRRTDYFLGTCLVLAGISFFDAVLVWLLSIVEYNLTNNWWTDLHFFHLPYFSDGNLFEQFAVYFLAMLHICFMAFAIISIFRRFGMPGLYAYGVVVGGIISIVSLLATQLNWWAGIFDWLGQQSAFALCLWLVPLSAIEAGASYLMLRRATV